MEGERVWLGGCGCDSWSPCPLSLSPAVGCVPHLRPTTRLSVASLEGTGQQVPLDMLWGAAVVWGVPGSKMWVGGEGLRQDLEWFALHWERVNQEECWGEEDIIDFGGSSNISSTEIQWINEPSLEEKMIAIHLGDGKGWSKKYVPLLSFLQASLIFPERDSFKVETCGVWLHRSRLLSGEIKQPVWYCWLHAELPSTVLVREKMLWAPDAASYWEHHCGGKGW